MRRNPQNIESLFELKRELEQKVTVDISELNGRILQCREIFEVLEERHFQAEGEDLTRLWKLFCLPEELNASKQTKIEELNTMKSIFFLELVNQQSDFNENISETENEIMMLFNYTCVAHLESVTEKIDDISGKLTEIKERVEVFNKRETLLKRNLTDYSIIGKLEGSFMVYKELWSVIRRWTNREPTNPNGQNGTFTQLVNKLNGFLTYFNEKKSKETLKLIEMIEGIKVEVEAEMI